ncbi:MAG: class I SAM-dependent methyltransferase [Planctomycetota bacterium]|jgi:predicted SAM-dependent methyltransferase
MALKINAGSGQRPFDTSLGWTNVDIQERWKPDVVADWRDMPMFENGSAEIIVAHHTIEHVGCGEAKPFFFKEAHRILQPGGSLIVTIPDLRKLAQRWITYQMDDYQFFVNVYGAYMGDENDIHRWGYSLAGLEIELVVDGGFKRAKPFDWREIPGASICRDWWILGVEAIK